MMKLLTAGPCYGIADLLVSAPAAAAFAPSLGVQTSARMIAILLSCILKASGTRLHGSGLHAQIIPCCDVAAYVNLQKSTKALKPRQAC